MDSLMSVFSKDMHLPSRLPFLIKFMQVNIRLIVITAILVFRTSKSANIPSANICMNCHSAIVKVADATDLSTEIQKIYDAKANNQPIEWVRVHNLPDLAYFNHAQHLMWAV
jgi:hypothetical protein